MTSKSIDTPLFDEEFVAAIVDAALKDPSFEPALLEDFDGTVKTLGLTSPIPGKLSKAGGEYTFSYDGGEASFYLETPVGAHGELSDRDLDVVAGGGIKETAEKIWKAVTSNANRTTYENSKVELHPIDRQP